MELRASKRALNPYPSYHLKRKVRYKYLLPKIKQDRNEKIRFKKKVKYITYNKKNTRTSVKRRKRKEGKKGGKEEKKKKKRKRKRKKTLFNR
jgi:hypothetical protein